MIFAISFALVLGLLLVARPLAARLGLIDHPYGGHKIHDLPTPVVGGPVIFMGVVAAMLVAVDLASIASRMLLGIFPLMLLGLVDDLWRLKPTSRLIIQIAVVVQLMVGSHLVFADLGGILGQESLRLPGWQAYAFTLVALVGLVNAINLVDGMDGLAAGLSAIALSFLLLLCVWLESDGKGVIWGLATLGGLVAFMLFNMRHPWNPKASVFLGDSGSLLVGMLLGITLVRLTQPASNTYPVPPVLGLWLLLVPVFDTCSVMIRRLAALKNPMHPDREHLHHLLMQAGLTHAQTVVVMLLAAAAIGALAIALWAAGVSEQTLFIGYLLLACAYLAFVMRPKRAVASLSRLVALFSQSLARTTPPN